MLKVLECMARLYRRNWHQCLPMGHASHAPNLWLSCLLCIHQGRKVWQWNVSWSSISAKITSPCCPKIYPVQTTWSQKISPEMLARSYIPKTVQRLPWCRPTNTAKACYTGHHCYKPLQTWQYDTPPCSFGGYDYHGNFLPSPSGQIYCTFTLSSKVDSSSLPQRCLLL